MNQMKCDEGELLFTEEKKIECMNCNEMTEPYEHQPVFKFCHDMDMNKIIYCKICLGFLQAEEKREIYINKQLAGEIDCDGNEIDVEAIKQVIIDLPTTEEFFSEDEEKIKYIVDDIVITDENYRRIQKMISKKYYDKHVDAILTRSLIYYENNRERVLARNKANYRAKKHDKLQDKYTKAHEKYLKTLTECKSCGQEKQMKMQFCDACIILKFGENIIF